MSRRSRRLSFFALISLSGCLLACNGKEKELEAKLQTTQQEVEKVRATSADRDKLYAEVVDAAGFVSDIQLELSKARARSGRGKTKVTGTEPERPTRSRAELLGDLRGVLAHLDSVERRVAALDKESSSSTSAVSAIKSQVASLQKTIASLRAAAMDQQKQVEDLTVELASTQRERNDLADKVVTMTDQANTVYMVAKPLPELLKSGVLVEEGGRKLLGLGPKRGTTLVPARVLHESDFASLNMTADQPLNLPHPEKHYQIASRHNGKLLSPAPGPDGTISGQVKILDPAQFWSSSRFLILIER